jgi:hypothetical protein
MKAARWKAAVEILVMQESWLVAAVAWLLVASDVRADGCFVFRWNKQKDINEPTQKAIIVHDQGREDLVLQVKYDGPVEDFGWLIPVPGLPEVRKGSMECFYELSKLTQEHFRENHGMTEGMTRGAGGAEAVKVIEIKTVGAYEVAVIAAGNAASLSEWLEAHEFVFPKEKQDVVDGYIKKGWYFVAARINPNESGFTLKSGAPKKVRITPSTRKKLASGELHPLVISFPSEKSVFPLAISAVNGRPSEVSLYVLSAEPVMSRVIFEKRFEAYLRERAEWVQQQPERQRAREEMIKRREEMRGAMIRRPNDPDAAAGDPRPDPAIMRQLLPDNTPPQAFAGENEEFSGGRDLVLSMEVGPETIRDTARELPRLKGKRWWLTKQVQTFAAEDMRDLEFEPAVPILAKELRRAEGEGPAHCLAQFGARALPTALAGLQSTNAAQRWHAMLIVAEGYMHRELPSPENRRRGSPWTPGTSDQVNLLLSLLSDEDARIREKACETVAWSWDPVFAPRLTDLMGDNYEAVRSAACQALRLHESDLGDQLPVYRKMVKAGGPAAAPAMVLLTTRRDVALTREELVGLLSSTNLSVVRLAVGRLREQNLQPSELAPLLTNSLLYARVIALGAVARMGDKAAVECLVGSLRDSNEAIRWLVRSNLRRLTGQKLGAEPAAWEQWWRENEKTFTPRLTGRPGLQRN